MSRLVMAETGEQLAPRTIERRAAEFRAAQLRQRAAREQMDALVPAVELKARQIAMQESKLKLLLEREKKVAEADKTVGKELTPEEFHQRVRDIYGVGDKADRSEEQ